MGNCFAKNSQQNDTICKLIFYSVNKSSVKFKQLLGVGAFGKVWRVIQRDSGHQYAIKVLSKNKILAKKSVKAVLLEKQIHQYLSQYKSNLIVNMIASSQDRQKLYLVMQYVQGYTLRSHMQSGLTLSQAEIKYLVLNLFKSLQFIHQKGVIHGDVKPENIIIDLEVNPRLMDFGLANNYSKRNYFQTGGTLAYKTPEVLLQRNHGYSVDHYAAGIITFELFFKKRPHTQTGTQDLKNQILNKEIDANSCPQLTKISQQASDFIQKLVQRKAQKRLGFKSINEVFEHPWLKLQTQADLQLLEDKTHYLEAFKQSSYKKEVFDTSSDSQDDNMQSVKHLLDRQHIQKKFQPYTDSNPYYPTQLKKISVNELNGQRITSMTASEIRSQLRKSSQI